MTGSIPLCLGDIGHRPNDDPACVGCNYTSDCLEKFEYDVGNGVEVPEDPKEED